LGLHWQGASGNLTKHLPMHPLLMIPLLTATGLAGFWLFYKSVSFFDHI
jgi:hypothetical protein